MLECNFINLYVVRRDFSPVPEPLENENVPYRPPPPGWSVTLPFRRASIASATLGWTEQISGIGALISTSISLPNKSMNESYNFLHFFVYGDEVFSTVRMISPSGTMCR